MNAKIDTVSFNFFNDKEKQMALEQYKIIADSFQQLNDTRENSNNFWIGANTLASSVLAYLLNTSAVAGGQRTMLLWTIIVIGIGLDVVWLFYLRSLRKEIEARKKLLVALEKHFAVSVFALAFTLSGESADKSPLTIKEMLVPNLFIVAYVIFGVLFFYV